jgi:hypothetical protein
MELSLRRWKPGQLLLGWATYWVGLVGTTLGPAIGASWRATRLPEGHGSIEAGFANGTIHYTVVEDGVKTWTGATSMTTALLWLAVPPLVLWVAWLIVRDRPDAKAASLVSSDAAALSAGSGPAAEYRPGVDTRVGVDPGAR